MHPPLDYEPNYEAREERRKIVVTGIKAAAIGLGALGAAYAFASLFLWATQARAHDAPASAAMPEGWSFDGWCCNGNAVEGDCDRIPTSAVKPVDGGFQVTLRPGDHRLVTAPQSYPVFAQKDVRNAPDGYYYACLYPTEKTLRCLYGPPIGF